MALEGKRIVITGATGQVGGPIARALAADNEVIAAARFGEPAVRSSLEDSGVTCAPVDLRSGDLSALPRDGVDAVLNFAVGEDPAVGRRPAHQRRVPRRPDRLVPAGAVPALLDHRRVQAQGPRPDHRDRRRSATTTR